MFRNLPKAFKGDECKRWVGKSPQRTQEIINKPYFRFNEYTDVNDMGDRIGKNLQGLNKLNRSEVATSRIVGDGYLCKFLLKN